MSSGISANLLYIARHQVLFLWLLHCVLGWFVVHLLVPDACFFTILFSSENQSNIEVSPWLVAYDI